MDVAGKLQIKPGQSVCLLNMPDGVDVGVNSGTDDPGSADAVVLFVAHAADLEESSEPAVAAARRDALAWVAYPKAGQLDTDLNRDRLAELMVAKGVRPVRQVSVDAVWSALRFRPPA